VTSTSDGSVIPLLNRLFRRLHHTWWVSDPDAPGGRRLSSQAFRPDGEGCVSVGLESVLSALGRPPEHMIAAEFATEFAPPGTGLAAVACEDVTAVDIALVITAHPTDKEPWHAVLFGVARRPKKEQKAVEDRLAELATQQILVIPRSPLDD
jgi:hypothetical protein